jgi:hypothetical protein
LPREIQAFSFQTALTFGEAMKVLGIGEEGGAKPLGDWYERDSAWYDRLLSRRDLPGVRVNLYFFDGENVLELKYAEDGPAAGEVEEWAVRVLLPALGARDVRSCESVD